MATITIQEAHATLPDLIHLLLLGSERSWSGSCSSRSHFVFSSEKE
jgi:hypothetical protein